MDRLIATGRCQAAHPQAISDPLQPYGRGGAARSQRRELLTDRPAKSAEHYGAEFKAWFIKSDLGISFLFRLADETGVVLLPGKGFEVVDTSARISLANLTEIEYASIGKFTRQVLDECYQDFQKTTALQ